MEMKKVTEIQTHELFENLFPIDAHVLKQIEDDMRDGNYDFSQPIILATWEGQKEPVCVDGHTRLQAAKNTGIEEVPVFLHEFDTQDEALEKAVKLQRNRRNMTDAEIISCIETLDKRKPRGGDRRSEEARSKVQRCPIENEGCSAQETGDLLGISERKVKQARTVMDHADVPTKKAVKKGDLSINQAYKKTQKQRKQTTAKRKKALDEAQGHEQVAEEAEPSTVIAPVFLSLEHFGALRELGGSIEEHVASAIDLYLECQREEYRGVLSVEMSQHAATVVTNEDHYDETANDGADDDEDEWFDPADYDEEPRAEGMLLR